MLILRLNEMEKDPGDQILWQKQKQHERPGICHRVRHSSP
jgi:hypothetical protein